MWLLVLIYRVLICIYKRWIWKYWLCIVVCVEICHAEWYWIITKNVCNNSAVFSGHLYINQFNIAQIEMPMGKLGCLLEYAAYWNLDSWNLDSDIENAVSYNGTLELVSLNWLTFCLWYKSELWIIAAGAITLHLNAALWTPKS